MNEWTQQEAYYVKHYENTKIIVFLDSLNFVSMR